MTNKIKNVLMQDRAVQLIERFEAKIKITINRVWGEGTPEFLGENA